MTFSLRIFLGSFSKFVFVVIFMYAYSLELTHNGFGFGSQRDVLDVTLGGLFYGFKSGRTTLSEKIKH